MVERDVFAEKLNRKVCGMIWKDSIFKFKDLSLKSLLGVRFFFGGVCDVGGVGGVCDVGGVSV